MKHFLRLTDYTKADIYEIFHITDEILEGHYQNLLQGKSVVLFFPESSIRTRVTFEKGIGAFGRSADFVSKFHSRTKRKICKTSSATSTTGQSACRPPPGYGLLWKKSAASASVPVINALTDANHPCEMAADLYALSKYGMILPRITFCSAVSQEISGWLGRKPPK